MAASIQHFTKKMVVAALMCIVLFVCTLVTAADNYADRLRELVGKSGYVDKCKSGFAIQIYKNADSILASLGTEGQELRSCIREVNLTDKSLSDSGWRSLALYPNLSWIQIERNCKWTKEASNTVTRLSDLRVVWAQNCEIDGSGLKSIATAKKLEVLMIGHNPIEKGHFESLAKLTILYQLCLDETGITDDDLGFLSHMPDLGNLSISGTVVSDAGAMQIAKCEKLKFLVLVDTKITEKGIRIIREKCPKTIITWGNAGSEVLEEPSEVK